MPAPDSRPVSTAVKVRAPRMAADGSFRRPLSRGSRADRGPGPGAAGAAGPGDAGGTARTGGTAGTSQARRAKPSTHARAARSAAIAPYDQRQLIPSARSTVTSNGPMVAP